LETTLRGTKASLLPVLISATTNDPGRRRTPLRPRACQESLEYILTGQASKTCGSKACCWSDPRRMEKDQPNMCVKSLLPFVGRGEERKIRWASVMIIVPSEAPVECAMARSLAKKRAIESSAAWG
jgi:hypothetical protein